MTNEELSSNRLEFADTLEAIEFYYHRGWTDGLPVIPPTEKRVREFLEQCGRRPDDIVGVVPQRRRILTAEKVAINAIMAGCLPAYAPVVVTAVEAMTSDEFNLHASMSSTGGAAPLMIVSGAIVGELNINAGVNVFGPGNRANATIGRALRLVLMNLCAATPGIFDKSTLGHPGKYSYCIAEDEAASPWEPLRVSKGFSDDVSTVTVSSSAAPQYVRNASSYEPEGLLASFLDGMTRCSSFTNGDWVAVVCPEHAAIFGRHGWSRSRVQQYLAERCRVAAADLERCGRQVLPAEVEADGMVSMLSSPSDLTLVVAGGGAGVISAVVPPWTGGKNSRMVTRPIGVCVEC